MPLMVNTMQRHTGTVLVTNMMIQLFLDSVTVISAEQVMQTWVTF